MQTQTKLLGNFQIESGKVFVSDPCYDLDTECARVVENVKNGKWLAEIETKKVWGERVSKLICHHESVRFPNNLIFEIVSKDIGVDSGQAGVFDIDHFKRDSDADDLIRECKDIICENEPWYSMCCDKTLSKTGAGIIPFGVVSSSGMGDGTYTCRVGKRDGEICLIEIDFGLSEPEEGEDEEEMEHKDEDEEGS